MNIAYITVCINNEPENTKLYDRRPLRGFFACNIFDGVAELRYGKEVVYIYKGAKVTIAGYEVECINITEYSKVMGTY